MNKTIGILAHVDAGKTTLSEQLLFHTNSIRQLGRVDHKDAFLDSHDIERQRGITVFADQGMFSYRDSNYYILDTPGHVDFSPEMERAIQVMDYAIILVSAVEGIEGHTETVWDLLRRYQVPTFFFINKIDRSGADVGSVMEEIKLNLTPHVIDITGAYQNGIMSEELIEFVAEREDELLEYYMEKGYEPELWLQSMQAMIKENRLFPCTSGSALQDIGIEEFMEAFDQLTMTEYNMNNSFAGRVYKIRHDENGTRISFIKALSGKLKVRDEIRNGDFSEKIIQIRLYSGTKYKTVDSVSAGDLFAVVGLTNTAIGDGIGIAKDLTHYEMVPTLRSNVIFESSVNIKEALRVFRLLEAEDPSLNVVWVESLQQIHIHVMGAIQLEVLEKVIFDRFQLKVTFAAPEILYKETIAAEVNGYGHFEPLMHYAEVHLKLEPGPRNSGILFENVCHPDEISVGHQNLIRHHLFEREHHGLLTGSPLTDVKVTLLTGRSHQKHTSGGDFREATFRALRQGLEKATNILLEPFYQFKIKVSIEQMGRVLTDIQRSHGSFHPPTTEGDKAIITGKIPVATFMHYPSQLAAFTGGKGSVSLVFSGYEECHNEAEVIERFGYDKDADSEYTSASIFCSKGAGYSVSWDEAEKKMHGLK